MTGRCRRAGIAIAAWLVPIGPPLAAQTVGALSLGASFIEYDGFLRSGAAVLAPALRFDSPRFTMGGQGSWTVFESGNGVLQGTVAAAWLGPVRQWWRLEVSGSGGASKYAAEPGTGHLLGAARLHFFGTGSGGWVGASTGASLGGGSAVPLEVSAAGWTGWDRVVVVGTVTATSLGPERHLDLVGAVRWSGSRFDVEARVGARPWTRSPGGAGDAVPGGYGELTAIVPLTERLGVTLSGGSYPSDPVRRVLGAKYLSAGVRLRTFGPRAPVVPLVAPALLRGRSGSPSESGARLGITGSGSLRIISLRAVGVRSVELMADFTDWSAVALTQRAPGLWEIELPLSPGIYRVNVRLDGGPWAAPAGTRVERTEFGGEVGIVVVP